MDDWSQAQIRIKCSRVCLLCTEGQWADSRSAVLAMRAFHVWANTVPREEFGLLRRPLTASQRNALRSQLGRSDLQQMKFFFGNTERLFCHKVEEHWAILILSGSCLYSNSLYSSENRALVICTARF